MGWNSSDDKNKKHLDGEFVSCEEEYEMKYLAKEYNVSEDVVKKCCQTIQAPHKREDVEKCIKKHKNKKSSIRDLLN